MIEMKFRGTKKALYEFLVMYVGLVNSGDAGNWNPFEEDVVIKALKVLGITKEQYFEGHSMETDYYDWLNKR
jgi:hypothetical protein